MELTVLGKYGPYGQQGDGAASSYIVSDGGTNLVMDMGSGTLSRLMNAIDVKNLDYIFLSHLHYDHTSDFLVFRYLLEDINHKVTLFTHYEDSEWHRILTSHRNINVVNIDEESDIQIGSMRLTFAPMKHTVTCYGIRIEGEKTIVYTGDTMFNDNILKLSQGADCILADCSKLVGFKGPHMTVEDAEKLQSLTGTRIIATHLSPGYSPENEFKNNDMITVAEELKTYKI